MLTRYLTVKSTKKLGGLQPPLAPPLPTPMDWVVEERGHWVLLLGVEERGPWALLLVVVEERGSCALLRLLVVEEEKAP